MGIFLGYGRLARDGDAYETVTIAIFPFSGLKKTGKDFGFLWIGDSIEFLLPFFEQF